MIIDVLQCAADGTQTLGQHEVADDYFPPTLAPEPDYTAFLDGIMEGFANG